MHRTRRWQVRARHGGGLGDDTPAAAQAEAGCGAAKPPEFSDRFVGIENQRGFGYLPPIMLARETDGTAAREAGFTARLPDEVPGLSLRYRGIIEDELLSYYSDSKISEDDTVVDLMADGGLMIVERHTLGADVAAEVLGNRAERVAVGSASAVMTWSDEMAKGVRPYQIAWTDRGSDWRVISGSKDPAVALQVARSIACG